MYWPVAGNIITHPAIKKYPHQQRAGIFRMGAYSGFYLGGQYR
jgi:hypothetical protein